MRMLFLAGTLALGISSAASAALLTTTFEGTVIGSQDYTNMFGGGANADYAGDDFTAVFSLDTALANPITGATFTVNGITFTMPAVNLPSGPSFVAGTSMGYGYVEQNSQLPDFYTEHHIIIHMTTNAPASYDTVGSWSGTGSLSSIIFAKFDETTQTDLYAFVGDVSATSAVTRLVGAGVPEPATWALMILGFGAAGAMLRRRLTPLLT